MELVTLPLNKIKPYERNPRNNNKAVDAVMESIRQCTYVAPIIVDENNIILAGHTRYKALKRLGYTEADVVVKTGLSEEQKRKYRLLDNKTNELAEWDFEMLAEELEGLDFGEIKLEWGIKYDDEDENNPYTKTVNLPQYEIKGDKPNLGKLFDSAKADQLIEQIENSSISNQEKDFLKMAAYRHVIIDFEAVAEYYANASKEMQQLMEDSALVLIDYDNAIANGFTALTESLEDIRKADCDET